MALIEVNFFSECLNKMTAVNVLLPLPRKVDAPVQELPVLYLLHGMGDDCTMWTRRTCVEDAALNAGLALVMPDGGMSCYENMAQGGRYRDFMLEELPSFIRKTFPVSDERERNFIAGCSMGGCGALKLALSAPEKFSVVGCFSAGHLEFRPDNPINQSMLKRTYGEGIAAVDARIERELASLAENGPQMRIFHYWGDRDILRGPAMDMRSVIEAYDSKFIKYTGTELCGAHDWTLWNACVTDLISRLDLKRPEHRLF